MLGIRCLEGGSLKLRGGELGREGRGSKGNKLGNVKKSCNLQEEGNFNQ